LAVIGQDTAEQLLIQLRAAWLMPKQLPSCIRHLFTGKRLSSLECGVLEAFIVDELRIIDKQLKAQEQSKSPSINTSGVPPPNLAAHTLPLESKHVA